MDLAASLATAAPMRSPTAEAQGWCVYGTHYCRLRLTTLAGKLAAAVTYSNAVAAPAAGDNDCQHRHAPADTSSSLSSCDAAAIFIDTRNL
jgi:hypothetical protein